MKEIKGLTIDKAIMSSASTTLQYFIVGDPEAVFSLQVRESSNNKFYNFNTGAFTSDFTSENTLKNISTGGKFRGNIIIPANASGSVYKFLVFAYPEFNTKISDNISSNNFLHTREVTQEPGITVRFSTASEQVSGDNLEGIGTFVGSTAGSSNSSLTTEVAFSQVITDADSLALGYKWEQGVKTNVLSDGLKPIDSDFFTKVATQTNGAGTNSDSMIVDSVSNLVIGMGLVSIADSGDLEQSGSLGVLTYPTITAINTVTKTVTLSDTPTWADDKAVVFRAYGSDLIQQSTGGLFEFNLSVFPKSATHSFDTKNYGTVRVNGAVSASTSIAIDNISGISVGSRVIGAEVDSESENNLVTAVHASGTPITVTAAQTLADNTLLFVHGSTITATIEGTITIKTFPTASTDVFYDIDRAFVLATNS